MAGDAIFGDKLKKQKEKKVTMQAVLTGGTLDLVKRVDVIGSTESNSGDSKTMDEINTKLSKIIEKSSKESSPVMMTPEGGIRTDIDKSGLQDLLKTRSIISIKMQ